MSSSEDCGMCANGWPLSGDRVSAVTPVVDTMRRVSAST